MVWLLVEESKLEIPVLLGDLPLHVVRPSIERGRIGDCPPAIDGEDVADVFLFNNYFINPAVRVKFKCDDYTPGAVRIPGLFEKAIPALLHRRNEFLVVCTKSRGFGIKCDYRSAILHAP